MKTLKEYAKSCGKSVDTIRRRVKNGELLAEKVNNKWYILEEDRTGGEVETSLNSSNEFNKSQQIGNYSERVKVRKDELEIQLKEQKLSKYRSELLDELSSELSVEYKQMLISLREISKKLCPRDQKLMIRELESLQAKLQP
ncbi:helix-turn-helix domain-containing protein [Lentisphaerota bacterium WC36G]|nr:helix-turn-helix domain-containing protein [Lentisphaerae bacterium WC36]